PLVVDDHDADRTLVGGRPPTPPRTAGALVGGGPPPPPPTSGGLVGGGAPPPPPHVRVPPPPPPPLPPSGPPRPPPPLGAPPRPGTAGALVGGRPPTPPGTAGALVGGRPPTPPGIGVHVRSRALTGRSAVTANPPSDVGPAVNAPPSAAARSRIPTSPCPPPGSGEPGARPPGRGPPASPGGPLTTLSHTIASSRDTSTVTRDPGACRITLLSASCRIR